MQRHLSKVVLLLLMIHQFDQVTYHLKDERLLPIDFLLKFLPKGFSLNGFFLLVLDILEGIFALFHISFLLLPPFQVSVDDLHPRDQVVLFEESLFGFFLGDIMAHAVEVLVVRAVMGVFQAEVFSLFSLPIPISLRALREL